MKDDKTCGYAGAIAMDKSFLPAQKVERLSAREEKLNVREEKSSASGQND